MLLTILLYYLIITSAIGATYYFVIGRPAIALVEEVTEEKTPRYYAIIMFLVSIVISPIYFPGYLVILKSNNNNKYITDLAGMILEKMGVV